MENSTPKPNKTINFQPYWLSTIPIFTPILLFFLSALTPGMDSLYVTLGNWGWTFIILSLAYGLYSIFYEFLMALHQLLSVAKNKRDTGIIYNSISSVFIMTFISSCYLFIAVRNVNSAEYEPGLGPLFDPLFLTIFYIMLMDIVQLIRKTIGNSKVKFEVKSLLVSNEFEAKTETTKINKGI